MYNYYFYILKFFAHNLILIYAGYRLLHAFNIFSFPFPIVNSELEVYKNANFSHG